MVIKCLFWGRKEGWQGGFGRGPHYLTRANTGNPFHPGGRQQSGSRALTLPWWDCAWVSWVLGDLVALQGARGLLRSVPTHSVSQGAKRGTKPPSANPTLMPTHLQFGEPPPKVQEPVWLWMPGSTALF